MTVRVSDTVASIGLSAIKDMAIRAARLEGTASLAWGLPSFRTPAPVREALTRALAEDPDIGKYTLPDGLAGLRRAVADTHAARGRAADPETDVVVTAGNMQGIRVLLGTLLDPGDEVIVTDPGFVSHIQQIRLSGGRPVFWPLVEDDGWRLDPGTLDNLIGPRTRAIILVNPHNPTGAMFTADALAAAAATARRRGIAVLLDDPYSGFRYAQSPPAVNLADDAEWTDTVVYLYTFSKVHAMSGFRLGYMLLPPELKRHVLKVHDANIICPPRASQIAGLAALADGSPHVAGFSAALEQRLSLICERLDRLPHVFRYVRPKGAYYVFPRILVPHADSVSFALDVLENDRVSLTPGSAFGPGGERHVRMAFCVEEATINLAFDRLEHRFGAA